MYKKRVKLSLNLFVFLVLILSYFDTVSRFPNDLSPFRVLSILSTMILMLQYGKEYIKYNIFVFVIGLYSILMIILWGGSYKYFINIYIHWLFVYFIFISIKYLSKEENFEENFFVLIDRMTVICVVIFFVEYITGIKLFKGFIVNKYKMPSSVYYGINDFVLSILPVGVLYMAKFIFDKKIKYLFKYIAVLIPVVMIKARSGTICMILAPIILSILRLAECKKQFLNKILTLVFYLTLSIGLIFWINPEFRGTKVSEFFISLNRIIKMRMLFRHGIAEGSLEVRTDAVIAGIKSFFNSYGFGLGIGGCTNMLINYNFLTLQSMHNILMELVVDIGWLAILFFVCMVSKVFNCYRFKGEAKMPIYALSFVLLSPLFAVQSSGGVLSIYPFWIAYFYIFICCFNLVEKTNYKNFGN